MININRTVLVGRLTKDIELRKTQSGISTTTFTIAVNNMNKNQDGTHQADFIQCVAWRQSADFLQKYAHKGDLIGVEGRISTRSYDRQDGSKAYITEVVCDRVSNESKEQSNQGYTRQNQANQDNWNYSPEANEDDMPF